MSNISKFSLIKNLLFSDSSTNLADAKLEDIPLFGFLLKLVKTLPVSDYHLNIECFRESIILTEVDPKGYEPTKDVSK